LLMMSYGDLIKLTSDASLSFWHNSRLIVKRNHSWTAFYCLLLGIYYCAGDYVIDRFTRLLLLRKLLLRFKFLAITLTIQGLLVWQRLANSHEWRWGGWLQFLGFHWSCRTLLLVIANQNSIISTSFVFLH
jgi:hypothetical protein